VVNTEPYRIVVEVAGAVPQDNILERFKLLIHRETREMSLYALVLSKNGPRLKEAMDEGATQISPDGNENLFERASMEQSAGTGARSVGRPCDLEAVDPVAIDPTQWLLSKRTQAGDKAE
jgi:uncharacterized protein (TIGR03435 family)